MKYLKKSAGYVVLIIALLFLQAYCDLSLPDYTSKIVNVGIQQSGIEDSVPEKIRKTSMDNLKLFMDEEDKKNMMIKEILEVFPEKRRESLDKAIDLKKKIDLFAELFLPDDFGDGGFSLSSLVNINNLGSMNNLKLLGSLLRTDDDKKYEEYDYDDEEYEEYEEYDDEEYYDEYDDYEDEYEEDDE